MTHWHLNIHTYICTNFSFFSLIGPGLFRIDPCISGFVPWLTYSGDPHHFKQHLFLGQRSDRCDSLAHSKLGSIQASHIVLWAQPGVIPEHHLVHALPTPLPPDKEIEVFGSSESLSMAHAWWCWIGRGMGRGGRTARVGIQTMNIHSRGALQPAPSSCRRILNTY